MQSRLPTIDAVIWSLVGLSLGIVVGASIQDAQPAEPEYVTDPAVCRMALREFAYHPPKP